jgi:SAM-dependent methyltransferase
LLHRLRLAVKPLVPVALHGPAKALTMRATALALRGSNVECPCCGGRFRRFLDYPAGFCPRCSSYERHRFLCLLVDRHPELLRGRRSVLHVGPEPSVTRLLQRAGLDDYLSIDLDYRLAMERMDVTELKLPDDRYDLVVCSHVLIEVPDQRRALGELLRVLRPGGLGLFGTALTAQRTPPVLRDELAAAGFEVRTFAAGELGPELVARHGLIADEELYAATKPRR